MLGEGQVLLMPGPVMGLQLYRRREHNGLKGKMAKGARERGRMERLSQLFELAEGCGLDSRRLRWQHQAPRQRSMLSVPLNVAPEEKQM